MNGWQEAQDATSGCDDVVGLGPRETGPGRSCPILRDSFQKSSLQSPHGVPAAGVAVKFLSRPGCMKPSAARRPSDDRWGFFSQTKSWISGLHATHQVSALQSASRQAHAQPNVFETVSTDAPCGLSRRGPGNERRHLFNGIRRNRAWSSVWRSGNLDLSLAKQAVGPFTALGLLRFLGVSVRSCKHKRRLLWHVRTVGQGFSFCHDIPENQPLRCLCFSPIFT